MFSSGGLVVQETSLTLLKRIDNRLASEQCRSDAWNVLFERYTPLVRHWLRQSYVRECDFDEVIQEVAIVLCHRLRHFRRLRAGSFRLFLKRTTWNCIRDHVRRAARPGFGQGGTHVQQMLHELPAKGHSHAVEFAAQRRELLQQAMVQVKVEFHGSSWSAFQLTAIENRPVSEVALQLEMSPNAVSIAKSRVLKRLRERAAALSTRTVAKPARLRP